MSETQAETVSVALERELPYPPEKLWRALTQPHLIEEWLMKNDFQPKVDHRFKLSADWGSVDCQVLEIEPNRSLTFSWTAYGQETLVVWTLTPTATGALLRVEQSGFPANRPQNYEGAKLGWARFLGNLEQVLGRMD